MQMKPAAHQPLVDGAGVPIVVVAHLAIRTCRLCVGQQQQQQAQSEVEQPAAAPSWSLLAAGQVR